MDLSPLQKAILAELALLIAAGLLFAWQRLGSDKKQVYADVNMNYELLETSGQNTQSQAEEGNDEENDEKDFIHWVDFDVSCEALEDASSYDIETHGSALELHWVELLAVLACHNGGDFSSYRSSDMDALAENLMTGEKTIEELAENLRYYNYYREAYGTVLDGMLGEYQIQTGTDPVTGEPVLEDRYGLKAFLPIAKNFPYSDYDDFGVSRSYGYTRSHLGHDMMGQVGTPIIAVESGYVEAMGWNQYGGWRLGIRSFDGRRYYYYAHLRQNYPYQEGLQVGSTVTAGDVIGYLGRTGYSTTENTNNIDTPHLHFGIQLIFDESQKEGNGEIWIDCYQLIRFLGRNRSETVRDDATKSWHRITEFIDPAVQAWLSETPSKGENSSESENPSENENPSASEGYGESSPLPEKSAGQITWRNHPADREMISAPKALASSG